MLNVTNYYKNNKTVVIKLVFLTLAVAIFEAAGIFAIIPYVDVMFGQTDNHSYFISELLVLFPSLKDKTYITLFFLSLYLVRGLVLAAFIHKKEMIVGAAHSSMLNDLFQVSFENAVHALGSVAFKERRFFEDLSCIRFFFDSSSMCFDILRYPSMSSDILRESISILRYPEKSRRLQSGSRVDPGWLRGGSGRIQRLREAPTKS